VSSELALTKDRYVPAEIIQGALLYGSMLYFSSNALLLGLILILSIYPTAHQRAQRLILVVTFAAFALINLLAHRFDFDATRHSSSVAVLIVPFVAWLAPNLSLNSLRLFVIATCLEVFVGGYEFWIGQVALTQEQSDLANQTLKVESSLIYDHRVFGLSANSSVFAEKIYMSLILLVSIPGFLKQRTIAIGILVIGLFLSFNRTAIISSLAMIPLFMRWHEINYKRAMLLLGSSAVAIYLVVDNYDYLLWQTTRSMTGELSHSELSRMYLWENAIEKITENPLSGNGSLTFRVDDQILGSAQHAHNSILMLVATHGIVISCFLLIYIGLSLNRNNFRPLAAIFFFSMTQYFVFWNLSAPDFILYWFLGVDLSRFLPDSKTASQISNPDRTHPSRL
jgi:hypothetical protein